MNIEIDTVNPMSNVARQALHDVISAYEDMREYAPLVEIEVIRTSEDPIIYSYKLTHVDGREWLQMLHFENAIDSDPGQTFDVVDPWLKDAEFMHQRPVRDGVVKLITQAGMTSLKITNGQ